MVQRVNPNLIRELEEFGKGSWHECYHCGNCTATCSLAEKDLIIPRRDYRALQMGLEDTLISSLDPWLCYYCCDCSLHCPRDANPGETMMILRRYLTTKYDWTGISKKFYSSHWWELGAIFVIAIFIGILFGIVNPHGWIVNDLTPEGGVKLNAMFPVHWVHLGDFVMAAIIGGLLATNILRMWYFTVYKDKSVKIKPITYVTEFKNLIIHFFTQKRFYKSDDRTYWIIHWFLMSGYTILLIMIVFFLPWFQTEIIHPWYHPQRLFGYYGTIGLLVGLGFFSWGRIKKNAQMFRYTHFSDWVFIIMLFLTTVTGIIAHICRIYGMPLATHHFYLWHLMVLVPMLVIEVPFSKWAHLAYRPCAVYFARLKQVSKEQKI